MGLRERLRSTESRLFLLAVSLELVMSGVLLAEGRYPPTHDGLQHFLLQWFFLDGAATTGDVPRWIPWLTGGNVATWWWAIQASPFVNALSLFGTWLAKSDFLLLWHLGMLADELVLLTGVWLLARRMMQSPFAVFFTTVLAVGSISWAMQPWYSLRLVHAIPLLLELGHRFLETGRWRYAALAGVLLVVQSFGSLPYFFPVVTFTGFVWFASHLAISADARTSLRGIPLGRGALGAAALTGAALALAWIALHAGTDEVVQFLNRREADGTVTLDWFLSYGGNARMAKWKELVTRVSPAADYTVYVGAVALPFAIAGVLSGLRRSNAHVLVVAIVLLELSVAHPLSAIAYWAWPLMKYYRHLTLLGVLPKLFLCFLAGLGLDRMLGASEPGEIRAGTSIRVRPIPLHIASGIAAAALAVGAIWTWRLSVAPDAARQLAAMVPTLPKFTPMFDAAALPGRLAIGAAVCAIAAAIAIALAFPRTRRVAALAGLAIAGADLYAWKLEHLRASTTPLDAEKRAALAFTPLPWVPSRCAKAPCGPPERRTLLDPAKIPGGTRFNQISAVPLFEDELGSSNRLDNWLVSYDRFIRTTGGAEDPFDSTGSPPGFVFSDRLDVADSPAVRAAAGVTHGKLQWHRKAWIANEDEIVFAMREPSWTGEVLFIEDEFIQGHVGLGIPSTLDTSAAATVASFSANAISVDAAGPGWLYLADTWHGGWRATVDGTPADVRRANLAFRAIELPPGEHRVEMRFPLPALAIPQRVIAIASAALLALTALLAQSALSNRTRT